jgi:hypothetical protein
MAGNFENSVVKGVRKRNLFGVNWNLVVEMFLTPNFWLK